MLKLKSLGHACFTLATPQHSIVFDPWLAENPDAVCRPDEIEVDAILTSHGHSDHLGDAVAISKRLQVPIIAPFELAMYCTRLGCETAPCCCSGWPSGRHWCCGSWFDPRPPGNRQAPGRCCTRGLCPAIVVGGYASPQSASDPMPAAIAISRRAGYWRRIARR